MRKPIGLILLVTVVLAALELCIIARCRLGTLDPRCLVLRGYTVWHVYQGGREDIQCVRDAP